MSYLLTHGDRDKTAANLQTTFSIAFSWIKILFWFKFQICSQDSNWQNSDNDLVPYRRQAIVWPMIAWSVGLNVLTHGHLDTIGDNSLQWRHNGCDSVSNHQPHDCFLNRLFRHRSKKTSKLRVTGLCAGNSPEAGEFPAQMASNAENVSIWWRHHVAEIIVS